MRTTTFCLLLVLGHITNAQSNNALLHNTEQFTFHSIYFPNESFSVQMAFPLFYNQSKKYPVLYILDSDTSFGLVKGIADVLCAGNNIQEFIIVGFAYNKGFETWWHNRARDYTPTRDTSNTFGKMWPQAGNADNLVLFIQNELIPHIEQKYNVDKKVRGLLGFSFGGLFTAYTLFKYPDMFDRYIIISPVLSWDDKLVTKLEADYAKINTTLMKKVFFSISSKESPQLVITPTFDLIENIQSRHYKGLHLQYENYLGDSHHSGYSKGITDGMRHCFPVD